MLPINAANHPTPAQVPPASPTTSSSPEVDASPNAQFPFGIDLSKWNTSADGKKQVNFNTIAAHQPNVAFIAMRAGISWGYQDPWFSYYFTETLRIQRIPMPYHVLYPGENATRQMDNFFRILGEINFKSTPLVLDLELDHGCSIKTITHTTLNAVNTITQRTGRIPIIYSRAQWVNQFLSVPSLPPVHWWLAQYRFSLPYPLYTPEYPSPPALPVGVHTWLFHQTTQRGRSIGASAMYYMDHNRFNGTRAALAAFAGAASAQTPVSCPLDGAPCAAGKTASQHPSAPSAQ